jgi:hypothetical protein
MKPCGELLLKARDLSNMDQEPKKCT